MKIKKKICEGCNTLQVIFSKGKCQRCASKQYKRPTQKVKTKTNKKELDTYFEKKINQLMMSRISEESGSPIPFPTRGNICHLLDKSRHKSVADHSDNYVFLTWDEHNRFDKLLFEHRFKDIEKEFPNSWPIILKRLEVVIANCTEKTKLVEALTQEINKSLTQ